MSRIERREEGEEEEVGIEKERERERERNLGIKRQKLLAVWQSGTNGNACLWGAGCGGEIK